jgi:hypothetical protein
MNLCRSRLIPFYLVLSAVNGVVPFVIVLLLYISVIYALAIWGLASAATFVLINLMCLRTAWKNTEPIGKPGSAEFEKVPA